MSNANELPQQGFSVLGGNPNSEELAVIVAVLQAASAAALASAAASAVEPTSSWSKNVGLLREPITPGRGQWRAAYRHGLSR
jgi:hypothetical protein